MITVIQAIILGALQGISELFPISSLGHTVILPSLFGWHNLNQSNQYFLTFIVATHFATAIVLFFFFKNEWMKIISGIFRSLKEREVRKDDIYAKFGWLLVVGTIPVGILGLLFQQSLAKLFASAQIAAMFLIVNGVILFGAEMLRKRRVNKVETVKESDKNISKLSWRQSFGIGLFQSAALLPGISRSGTSMAGGLLSGLNNEDAARFSFMLATPVIGVAALLKLPELFNPTAAGIRGAMLAGSIASGITAYISIRYLVKYFQTKTLTPFAVYCFVAGIIFSIYFFKQ